jgi:hypothetical protein
VKRFGYFRDPLCVLACGLYLLNRLWLKQHVGGNFLHGHFNDLLLIPAALPLVLWVQRRLGVRPTDERPRWGEIGLHVAVWSFAAEWVMPHVTARATGDWRDVVAYAIGAVVAGCWWQAPTFV